jgi:oligopeptidase B
MRTCFATLSLCFCLLGGTPGWAWAEASPQRVARMLMSTAATPPVAEKRPHLVQSPHGSRVDEYHWLRDDDPQVKRADVMAYLKAENAHTEAVLAPLAGLQQQLLAEMKSRIPQDDSTVPVFDRGWWTWQAYLPGAEHPRLMRQRGGPDRPDPKAAPQVMLDLPARAAGQAYYQLGASAISPDGRLLAFTEDTSGRRIHTLRVRNLVSGELLPDTVPGVLESVVWSSDSRSVFYLRQDPVLLQSGPVYRHRLGTPVVSDSLVYDEADKTLFTEIRASASRRYLLVALRGGDISETRALRIDRESAALQMVLARRPTIRHDVDHFEGRWVIRTNEGAVNFKLVSAPEGAPEVRRSWRTLVPGREQAALEGFVLLPGGVAVQERVEADQRVRIIRQGRSQALPSAPGVSVSLGARPDPRAAHLRYSQQSMVQPESTYDLDLASAQARLRKTRDVPGYDASLYATQRLWAPSRDGKRIPVTIAWRRDQARNDGRAPLLIDGYGAYGLSADTHFWSSGVSLMDRGFVLALAHVRGGADLGEAWFEDGRMMNKRNSFNDFVDVTDALLAEGWGAKDKVFASGGSAGGLLMGAVANQAGARYRGMLMAVPFVDVVTTMLDASIPLTINEYTQWGNPAEKVAYDYMLSYSPYDNLASQAYPAMYVSTGLWDSQVQYFEPAKYVARLRARKTDSQPVLLDTDLASGHGGASGRFAVLERRAREFSFLIDLAGLAAPPAPALKSVRPAAS